MKEKQKPICSGTVFQRHYPFKCGKPGAIEESGKNWCGIHAPSKTRAKEQKMKERSNWRSEAWDLDSKIRGAEDAVMMAAKEVYKSQAGAGWEMKQQRSAVHRLVRAYGELEHLRSDATAHNEKRPSGIRKV